MKNTLCIFIMLFLLYPVTRGQEMNRTIIPEGGTTPILIGSCNRDAFTMPAFQSWFETGYESYLPEPSLMARLAEYDLQNLSFTMVLGTWCPDSRREVPRFYRILDDLGISDDQVKMIGLDRSKSVPGSDISELKVYFVPTFIVYRHSNELGRIIEMPEKSLEEDLLELLNE